MLTKLESVGFQSCLPQKPFIEFGTGEGTKVDLNLPLTNEFSAYGAVPVDTTGAQFRKDLLPSSTDPYFSEIQGIKKNSKVVREEIAKKLREMFETKIYPQNVTQVKPVQRRNPAYVTPSYNTTTSISEFITVNEDVTEPVDYLGDLPFSVVVDTVVSRDVKPVLEKNEYTQKEFVSYEKYLPANLKANPQLFVVEEYRMAAYLGKYGMGRVVRTFSLLPGEKTTITLKTYKDVVSTKTKSENVLDSHSVVSSAEFETALQNERDSSSKSDVSTDFKAAVSGSGGFLGIKLEASTSYASLSNQSRASNVKDLNKALEKHVNSSNANRQLQVNTTTTDTVIERDESSTVRELTNINRSRVLNFVFKQLHQQYVAVTYLSDIKIMFTNGNPDDTRIVNLEGLDKLLNEVLLPAASINYNVSKSNGFDFIKGNILNNYCNIYDYNDAVVPFIEPAKVTSGTCFPPNYGGIGSSALVKPQKGEFWRKRKDVFGLIPKGKYDIEIEVPGVILSVKESTLKTSSVLVESMLGQADALDCFNLKIQDAESQKSLIENTERLTRLQIEESKAQQELVKQQAEAEKAQIANLQRRLQIQIVTNIQDPAKQAAAYKDVFGTCCETAQTVIQK